MEFRSQSAMEYLMTYGWAILIVAVVLGALYSLGIFNGANFLGGTCVASPGYLCTTPLLATYGTLNFTFGYQGANVTIVGFACTNTTVAPGTFVSSGIAQLAPGQEEEVGVSCPLSSSATIGTPYSGYLWVEYDQAGQSHLISRFATVRTSVSTGAGAFIYCLGGISTSNTYSAPLLGGGRLGSWTQTTSYPFDAFWGSCNAYQGYDYCVGGGGSSNAVYSSVLDGGKAAQWKAQAISPTGNYPVSIFVQSCTIYNGYDYCVGGADPFTISTVYSAPVSDGRVGPWTSTAGYPTPIEYQECTAYNGYVFCVSGAGFGYTDAVYSSQIVSGGSLNSWSPTASYPVSPAIKFSSCNTYNGYIYCVGGEVDSTGVTNTVYASSISGGTLGGWQATTPYPTPVNMHSCDVYDGYIYCVGGNGGVVYSAPLGGGTVGSWIADPQYPGGDITSGQCVISG